MSVVFIIMTLKLILLPDSLYFNILEGLPPLRWFISTFIPLFMAVWGYSKRSVNLSGALLGKYSYKLPVTHKILNYYNF